MNANKAKLSKSILEMKFMKRTKDKVEKQQFQEEGEEYFGSKVTERMKNDSERFIIEPSYVFCEKLIDGRVSFQGMNPEIEKLMEIEQNHERMLLEAKRETEVSDEQMAKHFTAMHRKVTNEHRYENLLSSKDNTDEPKYKKFKFLKPQD